MEEAADHLDQVVAGKYQARVGGVGVAVRESSAQQDEHQADGEREPVAGDQPRHRDAVVTGIEILLSDVGVALGAVDDDIEANHAEVVADCRLMADDLLPDGRCIALIKHARF
ncbi:hypothetical protein AWI43_32860 [Streptomyces sp. WAC04657]|nr:hypothetical protein AWI43_32860 [Streptomyces sp. WAC04657]